MNERNHEKQLHTYPNLSYNPLVVAVVVEVVYPTRVPLRGNLPTKSSVESSVER
jgi:hypothetical protein